MLRSLRLLPIPELRPRRIEPLPERLLPTTPKSTTRSTPLLMPLLSKPREMPRPLDPSTLRVSQRLLSLSESRGKYGFPIFNQNMD